MIEGEERAAWVLENIEVGLKTEIMVRVPENVEREASLEGLKEEDADEEELDEGTNVDSVVSEESYEAGEVGEVEGFVFGTNRARSISLMNGSPAAVETGTVNVEGVLDITPIQFESPLCNALSVAFGEKIEEQYSVWV